MKKKKVMVVDDEVDFLTMMKINLGEIGKYEVEVLAGAKDIVREVNRFKPDVILLDLLMPSIGGIEVCQMLNNDDLGRNTPIIILSALEKDKDKLMAYKSGVVDYLTKPIEIQVVIAAIEKALASREGAAGDVKDSE